MAEINKIKVGETNYDIHAAYADSVGSHNHSADNITSGTLPLTRGGTGATTAAGVISNIGAMDLTSAQTASGVKTFSNGVKIGNATLTFDSTNNTLVLTFA